MVCTVVASSTGMNAKIPAIMTVAVNINGISILFNVYSLSAVAVAVD